MRTRLHMLTLVACLVGATACRDEQPPAPAPPTKVAEPETPPEPEPHPLMQMRQAYGLPFPPEVAYVRQGVNFIEVGTKLRIPQLKEFFAQRLVDYEVVELGRNDVRFVALHSSAPDVRLLKRAPRIPIAVRYTLRTAEVEKAQQQQASNSPKLKAGDQVETRLGDGNLLAPGAVYGQPYTPQPGDPLYQERYRANFGKPFGTWVLN